MSAARIESLLDATTIEEQISLLAGRDFWTTVAIERLGIPSIKVSDGLNGARGGAFVGGVTAAAARLRTAQTADASRDHQLSPVSTGASRPYVDGDLVVDNWDFADGEEYFATASSKATGLRRPEAGRIYEITAQWRSPEHRESLGLTVLRMGLSAVIAGQEWETAIECLRHRTGRLALHAT
jgi:hypothetical protein